MAKRDKIEAARTLLAAPGAVLAPLRDGAGFGIYPHGDLRRRPQLRLTPAQTVAVLDASPDAKAEGAYGAVARLAEIAGPRGAAWFGGRGVDAALTLWRDWVQPSDPPPAALAGASTLVVDVLTAFRRGAGDFQAREAAWRWPRGAGAVALKLALDEAAQRYARYTD
jgi:hypothetical protein